MTTGQGPRWARNVWTDVHRGPWHVVRWSGGQARALCGATLTQRFVRTSSEPPPADERCCAACVRLDRHTPATRADGVG